MTRRASWLDLDHAASSEQPSNAALLGDEERGRMSAGTMVPSLCCVVMQPCCLSVCVPSLCNVSYFGKLASLQAEADIGSLG